ncbi:pentatricopeptide repeat-containing protein At2g29760, chloroplastic-like [Cornus florida]|uniref:pentatricopeptide repeat-containing protein At2g29760, chloroplastic-like n=1 Tax=Cornus florida TaxID=4283 RepID=UPI0028A0DD22|nr:pentatricopeptide repeat-containing protein At2g29760, chloroplastic-like [Cornus florida]
MNQKLFLLLRYKWGNVEKVKQIQAHAITTGLCNHQHFACKLINTYSKMDKPLEAQSVFNQIQNPDVVSWTCLISLYIRIERPSKAFSLFSDLILTGLRPDEFSIVAGLSACARGRDLISGKVVHGMVFRYGCGSDTIVGNALIDMYSRNGRIELAQLVFRDMVEKDVSSWTSMLNGFVMCSDFESARCVFDEMPKRNSISWTAMISGYVCAKTPIRALELFRDMRAEDEDHPTTITIVSVVSACADIGALDLGRSIHGYINKVNLITDVTVDNALIDMYSKSGALAFAMVIFGDMPKRNVFSWTTMISGLALHGKGSRALELFSNMLESCVTPNEVTFVSVLSACSHAGLVIEGQMLFNRMIQCYGLKPKIEHYGCMVDLLGRVGLLDEAVEFIEKMPIKPDAVIWRSLLSACIGRGSLKVAELAGKKVLELEPGDDGVRILLWNIYCSTSRWDDALKTRKMMREQKIKKKPGCSWVEVNGVVHEFLAEDATFHAIADVHILLEAIAKQSKLDFDLTSLE